MAEIEEVILDRSNKSGYYIVQFVARNLASPASVIAGRDTTTPGWMISSAQLPYVICGRSRIRNV